MLRSTRTLLPLIGLLALVPAGEAVAAKATFTGVFEAERSVDWDRPRIVTLTDCGGEHYNSSKGGETASMKSKPFKVTVETFGGQARFAVQPTRRGEYGIEANGPHKRWFERKAGNTGGWCDGAEALPNPENDCGTKIPTYNVTFYGSAGKMSWNAGFVSHMANEKLHFYKCTLVPPIGMFNSSFPKLEAKYRQADLFNRRKRTITMSASKSYGPTIQALTSTVNGTSKGSFSWKLVLTRR